MLAPTHEERERRATVMRRILDDIRADRKIRLPAFDPSSNPGARPFALIGIEPNDYSGEVSGFRYQFEGEDDLLHLMVTRQDTSPLSVDEARRVASFVLEGVPPALIWLKPGEVSQHFYVGHDELLDNLLS